MDWFKMQTVWGASVERFSDAEAGRFIKALFAYVRHGEEYDGNSGREDPLIWQAMETLRADIESFKQREANQKAEEEALKEKRRAAAKARWAIQNDANASKCIQADANDSSRTVCNADASENKNKNKNQKQKESKRVSDEPPNACARAFDLFWDAYPRKTGKQDAIKAFQRLNPNDALMQTIIGAIDRQKLSPQWTKDGGQFIPHPATWINGRRWEDEMPKGGGPVKTVSAQQYGQRAYTEAKLLSVGGADDLLAEARKARETA